MDDDDLKDANEPLDLDEEALGLDDETEEAELDSMGMHIEEPKEEDPFA